MTTTLSHEQRARMERMRDEAEHVGRLQLAADLTACLAALDAADTLRDHRCGGCGHRWRGDAPGTLCGDCWRQTAPLRDTVRELRAELESAADRESARVVDQYAHRDLGKRHAALVALVREWQEARKPATLSAPGEFLAETFQAAVRRMSAADEALAGYRLGASTGPLASIAWLVETHILSDLHYLRSWNARLSKPEWTVRNDEAWRFARREDADKALVYLAGGDGRVVQHLWTETGKTARACVLCAGTGNEGDERMGDVDCHGCGGTGRGLPSLRDELAEIIRWRFKSADGKPLDGAGALKHAQEIADAIVPVIEEAVGER